MKPGLNWNNVSRGLRIQAHFVPVTFSDSHHFASAKCDVQKKSLCDIAALY